MSNHRARVLLADDHAAVLEELQTILAAEFDVVAVVRDGSTLMSAAVDLTPDVIVTDIAMPGVDGLTATSEIVRRTPDARVVLVTMHDEPGVRRRGFAAGALGFVAKLKASDDLLPAVRAALRGERYNAQL